MKKQIIPCFLSLAFFCGCSGEGMTLNDVRANLAENELEVTTLSNLFGLDQHQVLCLVKSWGKDGSIPLSGHNYGDLDDLNIMLAQIPKFEGWQDTNKRYLFTMSAGSKGSKVLVLHVESGDIRIGDNTKYGCFKGDRQIRVKKINSVNYQTIEIL